MDCLRGEDLALHYCVTATTRQPRPTERHGVNHYFVEPDAFQAMEKEEPETESAVTPMPRQGT